jgi:hypothetical protein
MFFTKESFVCINVIFFRLKKKKILAKENNNGRIQFQWVSLQFMIFFHFKLGDYVHFTCFSYMYGRMQVPMVFLEFMISFVGDLVNGYIHLTCFQGADSFRVLPHPSARQKNQITLNVAWVKHENQCVFWGRDFTFFPT